MPPRTSATMTKMQAGLSACRFCSVFFFSSRRRHTRLQGDWSSDVCSSDLRRVRAVLRGELPDLLERIDKGERILRDEMQLVPQAVELRLLRVVEHQPREIGDRKSVV